MVSSSTCALMAHPSHGVMSARQHLIPHTRQHLLPHTRQHLRWLLPHNSRARVPPSTRPTSSNRQDPMQLVPASRLLVLLPRLLANQADRGRSPRWRATSPAGMPARGSATINPAESANHTHARLAVLFPHVWWAWGCLDVGLVLSSVSLHRAGVPLVVNHVILLSPGRGWWLADGSAS